jgi:hypothetical protein
MTTDHRHFATHRHLRGIAVVVAAGLALSCVISPYVAAADRCDTAVLRQGTVPVHRNLRLGAPVLFDDGVGINSGQCFPLFEGARLLTWLNMYHQIGDRLFVLRCEETAAEGAEPGSRSGAVAEEYVELAFNRGVPVFTKLRTPSWSELSNPAFCGAWMAYWGVAPRADGAISVSAIVVDLGTGRVVKEVQLGQIVPESDSRDFFERPRWSADGMSVSFCGRGADLVPRSPSGDRRLVLGSESDEALPRCR